MSILLYLKSAVSFCVNVVSEQPFFSNFCYSRAIVAMPLPWNEESKYVPTIVTVIALPSATEKARQKMHLTIYKNCLVKQRPNFVIFYNLKVFRWTFFWTINKRTLKQGKNKSKVKTVWNYVEMLKSRQNWLCKSFLHHSFSDLTSIALAFLFFNTEKNSFTVRKTRLLAFQCHRTIPF